MPDPRPCIKLYPKSEKQNQKYHRLARKARSSLSPFLLNIIDEAICEIPRPALPRDESLGELEAKCHDLESSLALKNLRIEQLEKEGRALRAKQWSTRYYAGVRQIDMALIELLRKGTYNQYMILNALKINPSDQEQIQAISLQLEYLEAHDLVERGSRGWSWKK